MPEMRVHSSGGIVFVPTKEEREIRNLKQSLKDEIDEARSLKEELLKIKNELKRG